MSSCHKVLTAAFVAAIVWPAAAQEMAGKRAKMVETIEAHAELAPHAVPGGGLAPEVLEAMRTVPRHAFVPENLRALAYEDRPLPIGYGQTISQPFIVALMTDLLDTEPGDRVLEIGTGSGYQAAVLAPLVDEVYSIEIVPGLGERAAAVLEELGYANVETKVADGYYGWPEVAPFDGIVVTAAANQIPPPLVEQLNPGGRMVIPIGGPFAAQQLMLVEKQQDGGITTRQVLPVQFVPFTRADHS
jgi:protein-L-isoaspartate(D-aspartate) O-methyltransferase